MIGLGRERVLPQSMPQSSPAAGMKTEDFQIKMEAGQAPHQYSVITAFLLCITLDQVLDQHERFLGKSLMLNMVREMVRMPTQPFFFLSRIYPSSFR